MYVHQQAAHCDCSTYSRDLIGGAAHQGGEKPDYSAVAGIGQALAAKAVPRKGSLRGIQPLRSGSVGIERPRRHRKGKSGMEIGFTRVALDYEMGVL